MTGDLTSDFDVIPPVSTEQFTARLMKFFNEIMKLISALVVPLAMIYCFFCIILIVVGSSSKSSNLKKTGITLLLFELLGVTCFYSLPLFIGFFKYLGQILNTA